jgi:uncharacterized membrane protein
MSRSSIPTIDQILNFDVPGVDTERLVAMATSAAYVAVGFAVLGVQKAQVRRRELTEQAKSAGEHLRRVTSNLCPNSQA